MFNFNFVQIKIRETSIHSLTVQRSLEINSTKFGILRILKGHFAFVFQFYYLPHCSMKCCLSRLIFSSSHCFVYLIFDWKLKLILSRIAQCARSPTCTCWIWPWAIFCSASSVSLHFLRVFICSSNSYFQTQMKYFFF